MVAVILDPQSWSAAQFSDCILGDARRNQRLMKLAPHAVQSILAVRLLQLKTAARETPDRPAHEVAPAR